MSSQKLSTVCSRPALVARAPALTLTPLHRTIADDGDVEIDSDSECSVDDEDIAAEEGGSAADMLQHATYWDHFLAYIDAKSVPWVGGEMAPPVCYFSFPTFCFDLLSQNPSRSVTPAEAGFLRTCSRGLSSCVRPKRSERRSAVDRAFGRARQARSTWTWSERAQVGASVAQKDGSRARGPPLRAGQHRVPEGRPKGGIAVSNMFEPAFASLSLQSLHWLALAL